MNCTGLHLVHAGKAGLIMGLLEQYAQIVGEDVINHLRQLGLTWRA
jgi:hypothetical protein